MRYKPDQTEAEKAMLFYYDAVQGWQCQCGRRKAPGRPLCYKCNAALPEVMRRCLFRKIGAGFEAAYIAAYQYLHNPKGDSHEKKPENDG